MDDFLTLKEIDKVTNEVKKKTKYRPRIGMILGSGLSAFAEEITEPDLIPYKELPGWPVSTIEGHVGRLVIGSLESQNVMVMQGRTHYYEGYSLDEIGLPVRVMQRLGVEILIITNAAGGINSEFTPGDLMLLTDHLNIMSISGKNPLRGPNLDEVGPRFPDMSQVYDRGLIDIARSVAGDEDIKLFEGVYVCVGGPSFETPAELNFLKMAGADAVGMSTVPEATVARHGGMKVLGISGISNKANLDGNTITSHEEVLEAGNVIVPKLIKLIKGALKKIELD